MRSLVVEVLPGYEHLVYVVVRDVDLGRLTEPLALSSSKQSRITHRGWLRLSQSAIDAALTEAPHRPFKQGHYRPDAEALHLVVRGYGESAEASLRATITADEPWFRVSGAEFAELVGGVGYAALRELAAPWCGLALETRVGRLKFAATDNHQAAQVEAGTADVLRTFSARVPRHAALAVSRLMRDEQIEVLTGPGAVEFRTERISVIAMPFHDKYGYPDISKLFLAERAVTVRIPRPALFEAELLLFGTGAQDDIVTFVGSGNSLIMSAVHPQIQLTAPATDVTVEGGFFRIMLNYRYLREVVQRARGDLIMWVGGPHEHVLLQSADSPVRHAIMPARRNEFAGGGKE